MVDRLGWTLVHFVWEGTALAAILAFALLLARRAPASLRHGLALAALAILAALPVATFVLLAPPSLAAFPGTRHFTPGETILGGTAPIETRMPLLVGLWAVGVAALSLRLVGAMFHLERWRRRYALAASTEAQARFDVLARRLGIHRRVGLFLSDRLEVPSAWGVLRPVVVLPASLMTGLPPAQVEGILLHELAHVRRHDYLVNLIQGVVETMLFYHPAVWWISSVVRRERERLCDDVAVAALGDPMPYARALLHLEERRQAPRPALSAREGDLMNRIARILAPKPTSVRPSPLAPSLAAMAVVALALGGVLRAEAQATKPTQPNLRSAKPEEKRSGWRKPKPKPGAEMATRKSLQVQLHRLESQLEAIKRLQDAEGRRGSIRSNGATYGTPGKRQHPFWSQKEYPQSVGTLVASPSSADRAAQDWAAMQKAQAELARGLTAQRKSVLSAEAAANRARVRADVDQARAQEADPKRRAVLVAQAQAAQARAEKAYLEAMRNRQALLAQTAATQAQATAAQKIAADMALKAAQKNRKAFVEPSAEDRARIEAEVKRAMDAAHPLSQADLARAIRSQREALQALSEAQKKSVFGTTQGLRGFDSTPWGKDFKDLDSHRGTIPMLQGTAPFGSAKTFERLNALSGLSLFNEPKIEVGEHGVVSIDAKDASFSGVVRALARKARLSVVIGKGVYGDVSLVVSDRSVADALAIVCRAAGADLRNEGGVYYVEPRKSATLGPGTYRITATYSVPKKSVAGEIELRKNAELKPGSYRLTTTYAPKKG